MLGLALPLNIAGKYFGLITPFFFPAFPKFTFFALAFWLTDEWIYGCNSRE